MPMTDKQIVAAFQYRASTDASGPKFAALREAKKNAEDFVLSFSFSPASYDGAFAEMGAFAKVIIEHCPVGEHRDAAIHHLLLARGIVEEAVRTGLTMSSRCETHFGFAACRELLFALIRANGAIATAGK